MSNLANSLKDKKVFATYKGSAPARIINVKKKGRKIQLLLRWEQYGHQIGHNATGYIEKWCSDKDCEEYILPEKRNKIFPTYKSNSRGKAPLAWWQKIIVNIQNWWYGINSN